MKKMSRIISFKMAVLFTVLAVLTGGLVIYYNSTNIENTVKTQILHTTRIYKDLANLEADEMAQKFKVLRLSLEAEMNYQTFEAITRANLREIVQGSIKMKSSFYITVDGDWASGYVMERINEDDIIQKSFQTVVDNLPNCPEMDTLNLDTIDGGTWVNVCYEDVPKRAYIEPVVQAGKLLGFVGGVLDMSVIEVAQYNFIDASSGILIFDNYGNVIADSGKTNIQQIGTFISTETFMTEGVVSEDIDGVSYEQGMLNDQLYLVGIAGLNDKAFIAYYLPQAVIDEKIGQSTTAYILVITLLLIAVTWVTYFAVDHEMKSFTVLDIYIRRLKEGNYTDRIPDKYLSIKHEAGYLARSFEQLREDLQKVFENLEDEKGKHHITQQELSVMTEVLENSNEGVLILNAKRRVIYANSAYCKISGYTGYELIGEPIASLDKDGADLRFELLEMTEENSIWTGEVTQQKKSGETYPASLIIRLLRDFEGQPKFYFIITEDLSSRSIAVEKQYNQMQIDVKTGLPNATQMRSDIEAKISAEDDFALIYMGIDDFKSINEIYGFNAGDAVIVSLSEKLPLIGPDESQIYRIGGDEFAFVVDLDLLTDGIERFVQQIQSIIRRPIRRHNTSIYLTASMGISSYPRDAQNTEILITSALSALNKAKTDARGFHYYFSKELREQSERRQMILSHLYEAIDRKELYLVYQPKVNALDGNLVGFEALLRWESHVMGFVSPVEFIPVAEESSMIEKIGRWVIMQATEDLKRIHDLGHEDMSISVNLSGQQFKDASLFAWILENISELDLKANRFELEITESLLLENLNEAVPQLNMLKESGIVISIDDFGTGYSSLSYLQHLPVDVLKIDRSFLKDLNEDSSGTIINAIIQLGSALEMKVVAEGIENEMQKQFLLNRGCSIHQGYYYSKPEKMDTLIENYKL